jgi:hypothetical protein
MDRWPFTDPPDLAVLTVAQVLRGGAPILYVTHDADDSGWQFLTGKNVAITDAIVVSLGGMIRHDPSLATLADLPIGWCAWRPDESAAWQRHERQRSHP